VSALAAGVCACLRDVRRRLYTRGARRVTCVAAERNISFLVRRSNDVSTRETGQPRWIRAVRPDGAAMWVRAADEEERSGSAAPGTSAGAAVGGAAHIGTGVGAGVAVGAAGPPVPKRPPWKRWYQAKFTRSNIYDNAWVRRIDAHGSIVWDHIDLDSANKVRSPSLRCSCGVSGDPRGVVAA
jgi:hypothetical protein